jgi:F-type H+-transporting ATPase subunit h
MLTIYSADLIQDLYLKELKAYKPPPQKASDAEGHVQIFSPPTAPKSPEETNLASDLKAYGDQVVEVEGQSSSGETQAVGEDLFEEPEPDDAPAHL